MSMKNRVSWQEWFRDSSTLNGRPQALTVGHYLMNSGRISVQERMTGYGYWDEETGYRSPCGKFWLANGHYDIRDYLSEFNSEDEMIEHVIANSNVCIGSKQDKTYGSDYQWLMQRENWKPTDNRATKP